MPSMTAYDLLWAKKYYLIFCFYTFISIVKEKLGKTTYYAGGVILSLVLLFSLPANQVSINQDCVKLLFEVIKSAVKFQKAILEGWMKVRSCFPCTSPFCPSCT